MYRSISTDAIVIRRERLGEFHKRLTLLTSDLGLITAAAYGAFKMQSRLRLGSEPFTCSRVQLYHDPVKRTYKVTEMEITATFDGLQSSLSRMAAASLWAEIAQKSYGAGDLAGHLYPLLLASLAFLNAAEPSEETYVSAQFLWRFLGLAGYQPDTTVCDRCGTRLAQGAFLGGGALLCAACAPPGAPSIPAGALRYLDATADMGLEQAMAVRLDQASLHALGRALPLMVQAVLEGELTSLRWVRTRA